MDVVQFVSKEQYSTTISTTTMLNVSLQSNEVETLFYSSPFVALVL